MAMMQYGVRTPKAVVYKHESHKLHQAFPLKSGDTILQGQPAMLNTDGTISPYVGTGIYLGIAVNFDSNKPPYPPGQDGLTEVTVMVEAFALLRGKAAAATQPCGYVTPGAIPAEDFYVPYTASDTETKFVQITPGVAAGDLVYVLVK